MNKGEVVWYINPQDILIIGKLFNKGIFDATRVIALTGSSVSKPKYYNTIVGTGVKQIISDGGLKDKNSRIISGNVLLGRQINPYGFLGFYDSQITIISKGTEPEFMGWMKPGLGKFSMSRAFFSWLTPGKIHNLDTNLHGEERP